MGTFPSCFKETFTMPPADDSFILHVLQCSYQIMTWRESLTSVVGLSSQTDYVNEIDTDTGQSMS